MSIRLDKVDKYYGEQKALDQVSFSSLKGEILALLGPNGAGKSTSMKIISAFIPFDSGSVSVCDIDVLKNPSLVKTKIGYLPEHNPLYPDMYVKEYLSFVADIHKVKNKKQRIAEVIELTGLQREQTKKIRTLSKGYKQRVGIAQAIFHEPEVLILDEPTSGLDPNQLVEIRALIKNLAVNKSVILSTHIMQEVEAISDRIVVIDKGVIVADAPTSELIAGQKSQGIIELEVAKQINVAILNALKGVDKVEHVSDVKYVIYSDQQIDLREELFDLVVKQDGKIISMNRKSQNIENVFRELTQS